MNSARAELGVIIPVYNESGAIASVLEKWRGVLDGLKIDYRIYAYNDGSKDDSLSILRSLEVPSNGHLVVVDKPNSGHGPTISRGYRDAMSDGCKWVFQVDSDDEISPEHFAKLWVARTEFDFVVGRRKHGPRSLARKIVSFVSRLAVRVFYGKGIFDVNVPYRLMRVDAFHEIIERLPEKLFAPNVVIAGIAARSGVSFKEIPVDVKYRATGVCSLNHAKLIGAAMRSFIQTVLCAFRGRGRVVALTWSALIMGVFCIGTNPIVNAMRGTDEAVFVYVGQAIRRGLLPYRDVFDHKGPLLYLFNYLGLTIGDGATWGIWFIESVLLVIGCLTLMRMSERVFHVSCSRFAVVPYLILLFCSTVSGNICETYSIFFITIAMCVLYKGIEKPLHSFVFGVCLASIVMMKFVTVGIAAVWGWLLIEAVFKKRYAIAVKAATSAAAGFALIVVPIMICLWDFGIFNDFWDVYIRFNLAYGRNCTLNENYHLFCRATIPVLIALTVNIWAIRRCNEVRSVRTFKLNLLLLIVSAVLVIGANPGCAYYYIPIYPACFLPFAYLVVCVIDSVKMHKYWKFLLACIGFGFMAFLDFRAAVYVSHYAKLIMQGKGVLNVLANVRILRFDEVLPFKHFIKDNSSVTVIGNNCQVYRTLGVTTPWRYPYQRPIYRMTEEVRNDIEKSIQSRISRYLVVNRHEKALIDRYGVDIRKNYEKITHTESYILLERKPDSQKPIKE